MLQRIGSFLHQGMKNVEKIYARKRSLWECPDSVDSAEVHATPIVRADDSGPRPHPPCQFASPSLRRT
jgi:hypothetical protein